MSLTPVRSVEQLEELLSTPPQAVVETMARLEGDIVLLGVGGKMGPTMARMAKRATDQAGVPRRVIGVSRFSSSHARQSLENDGVESIACDLLDEQQVAGLPDAPHVVFMAGFKFGVSQEPSRAWAMNCYVPALVCRRYRESRIVAFSTGNVYGLTPATGQGSRESDPLHPVGEYAMTALGRERMFEFFSRRFHVPTWILRLNYATELRYGVLVDLALAVQQEQPIDVTMGYVNVIWLGDANAMTLRALEAVPDRCEPLNLAGPEILRVRDVAEQMGRLLGKTPRLQGTEGPSALLSDGRSAYPKIGSPQTSAAEMIQMTAEWVARGGELLGKPTHFEVRDGKF